MFQESLDLINNIDLYLYDICSTQPTMIVSTLILLSAVTASFIGYKKYMETRRRAIEETVNSYGFDSLIKMSSNFFTTVGCQLLTDEKFTKILDSIISERERTEDLDSERDQTEDSNPETEECKDPLHSERDNPHSEGCSECRKNFRNKKGQTLQPSCENDNPSESISVKYRNSPKTISFEFSS